MTYRFHPVTTSNESLEILAEVPSGTCSRLLSLDVRYPRKSQAWYAELRRDADLGRLHSFLRHGFGPVSAKCDESAMHICFRYGRYPYTEIKVDENRALVTELLQAQGISEDVLQHITGIIWR